MFTRHDKSSVPLTLPTFVDHTQLKIKPLAAYGAAETTQVGVVSEQFSSMFAEPSCADVPVEPHKHVAEDPAEMVRVAVNVPWATQANEEHNCTLLVLYHPEHGRLAFALTHPAAAKIASELTAHVATALAGPTTD